MDKEMTITTEYRGYKIIYGENSDEWSCLDLKISKGSLRLLKDRIDSILLAERKTVSLPCLEVEDVNNNPKLIEGKIVEYLRPVRFSGIYRDGPENDHLVAVVVRRSGSSKASRREAPLSHMIADTPEARQAFEVFAAKRKAVQEAQAASKKAYLAIPRGSDRAARRPRQVGRGSERESIMTHEDVVDAMRKGGTLFVVSDVRRVGYRAYPSTSYDLIAIGGYRLPGFGQAMFEALRRRRLVRKSLERLEVVNGELVITRVYSLKEGAS